MAVVKLSDKGKLPKFGEGIECRCMNERVMVIALTTGKRKSPMRLIDWVIESKKPTDCLQCCGSGVAFNVSSTKISFAFALMHSERLTQRPGYDIPASEQFTKLEPEYPVSSEWRRQRESELTTFINVCSSYLEPPYFKKKKKKTKVISAMVLLWPIPLAIFLKRLYLDDL